MHRLYKETVQKIILGVHNMSSWAKSWGNSWGSSWGPILILTPQGLKVWMGFSWHIKPIKVFNGTSWQEKSVKRWTGSSWI